MSQTINNANQMILDRITRSRPHWVAVRPASEVIPALCNQRRLLHAGPPITWQHMTGPMRGACIGACLLEGWATDDTEALALLESGNIAFTPCHDVQAVGPMGGITSPGMPVLVVRDPVHGNQAFCNLNEGIGSVMRFGAWGPEVLARQRWIATTLAPVLNDALAHISTGVDLSPLMAQAITMGDEFHQRNIAASALLLRQLAAPLARLPLDGNTLSAVFDFLSNTEQFFLNLAMAYCKTVMDAAAGVKAGSIVTAMTRNGREFGIRISGLGNQWITAPVNTPQGLFFTGYSQQDASPDIGDSAITETLGLGGVAMVAAPGVTRFVGAGGPEIAQETSDEMQEIYLAHNPLFTIPAWQFRGACMGLDIRRVVETGITPLINTGIAHREPGIGQIGAGTVRAPLACFEQGLEILARELGIHVA